MANTTLSLFVGTVDMLSQPVLRFSHVVTLGAREVSCVVIFSMNYKVSVVLRLIRFFDSKLLQIIRGKKTAF